MAFLQNVLFEGRNILLRSRCLFGLRGFLIIVFILFLRLLKFQVYHRSNDNQEICLLLNSGLQLLRALLKFKPKLFLIEKESIKEFFKHIKNCKKKFVFYGYILRQLEYFQLQLAQELYMPLNGNSLFTSQSASTKDKEQKTVQGPRNTELKSTTCSDN